MNEYSAKIKIVQDFNGNACKDANGYRKKEAQRYTERRTGRALETICSIRAQPEKDRHSADCPVLICSAVR